MLAPMAELPKVISVDDHVVEPADVWTKRLPAKFAETGPRVTVSYTHLTLPTTPYV